MTLKEILLTGIFTIAIQMLNPLTAAAVPVTVGTNYFDINNNAVAAPSGSISIEETAGPVISDDGGVFGTGIYTLTNNTSFTLQAFGVSNLGTTAFVNDFFLPSPPGGQTSNNGNAYDFDNVLTLTDRNASSNWRNTEVIAGTGQTFQNVFGNFSENVDPGDDTINWYASVAGGLLAGDTSSSDYLRFITPFGLASAGIGIVGTNGIANANSLFFNNVSVVPLPAALPLYGTGLALMGFVGWRRRQKATA